MSPTRMHPLLALLVVVAGIAWAVAWGFGGQASGPTDRALGLTEGGWRATLNPALIVVLAGAIAWTTRQRGSAAALAIVAGIGAMLAGNLLEFGLLGQGTPASAVGRIVFVAGTAIAIAGLGWWISRVARAATGRRGLAVVAGSGLAIGLAVVSAAVPPAAALALLPMVDGLLVGTATDDAASEGVAPRLVTALAE